MEAERRSTMSSLKGQLSNVEGSVKSMKAAVVVGSVLTVACLAAVFGVTILANEVSKEDLFSLFSQAFGLTTRDVFSMIHPPLNHSCRFFSCLSLKGGVPLLVGRGVHREGVELGQEAGV